jgi:hypothetical protein
MKTKNREKTILTLFIITSLFLIISSFGNAVDMTNGLKGYWSFDNVTGTNIINYLNNGVSNFTTTGSPSYVSGVNGNALMLGKTGLEQYATATNQADFNTLTNDFSYCFWLNISSTTQTSQAVYVLAKDKGTNNWEGFELSLYLTGTDAYFVRYYSGSSYGIDSNVAYVSNNSFMYYCNVRTGNMFQVYINNTLIINASITMSLSNTIPFQIGRRDSLTNKANFTIDEFTYYNKSLSSSDVNILFNQKGNPIDTIGQTITTEYNVTTTNRINTTTNRINTTTNRINTTRCYKYYNYIARFRNSHEFTRRFCQLRRRNC